MKTWKLSHAFVGICFAFAVLALLLPEAAQAGDERDYSSMSLMDKIFSIGEEVVGGYTGGEYAGNGEEQLDDRGPGGRRGEEDRRRPDENRRREEEAERRRQDEQRQREEDRRRQDEQRQREEDRRRQDEQRRRDDGRRNDRKRDGGCDSGVGAYGMAAPLLLLLKKRRRTK